MGSVKALTEGNFSTGDMPQKTPCPCIQKQKFNNNKRFLLLHGDKYADKEMEEQWEKQNFNWIKRRKKWPAGAITMRVCVFKCACVCVHVWVCACACLCVKNMNYIILWADEWADKLYFG